MEEYRIIEEFKNYSVSNLGNVKNNTTSKVLKPGFCYGYACVSLNKKTKRVHILVAQAFIENPFNKPMVDHINSIRSDNRKENLRWATVAENNANQKIRKTNTSGFKGIDFDKFSKSWVVRFPFKKFGCLYYKQFDNIDEAIIDRVCKVVKLYGEYVKQDELFLFLGAVRRVYKHKKY
jgi:hypothetical protein